MRRTFIIIMCALLIAAAIPLSVIALTGEVGEHEHQWVEHFHYNYLGIYAQRYKECSVCHEKETLRIEENEDFVGDVNNDECVDIVDYILAKRHYSQTETIQDDILDVIDLDLDGAISEYDILSLRKLIIGEGSEGVWNTFNARFDTIKDEKIAEREASQAATQSQAAEESSAEEIAGGAFVIEIYNDKVLLIVDRSFIDENIENFDYYLSDDAAQNWQNLNAEISNTSLNLIYVPYDPEPGVWQLPDVNIQDGRVIFAMTARYFEQDVAYLATTNNVCVVLYAYDDSKECDLWRVSCDLTIGQNIEIYDKRSS